jgi:hypothetical protein
MRDPFLWFGPDTANAWFVYMDGPRQGLHCKMVDGVLAEDDVVDPPAFGRVWKFWQGMDQGSHFVATWRSAFPWIYFVLFTAIAIWATYALVPPQVGDKPTRYAVLWGFYLFSVAWAWYYSHDPVTAAKIEGVYIAASIAREHQREAHTPHETLPTFSNGQAYFDGQPLGGQRQAAQPYVSALQTRMDEDAQRKLAYHRYMNGAPNSSRPTGGYL